MRKLLVRLRGWLVERVRSKAVRTQLLQLYIPKMQRLGERYLHWDS